MAVVTGDMVRGPQPRVASRYGAACRMCHSRRGERARSPHGVGPLMLAESPLYSNTHTQHGISAHLAVWVRPRWRRQRRRSTTARSHQHPARRDQLPEATSAPSAAGGGERRRPHCRVKANCRAAATPVVRFCGASSRRVRGSTRLCGYVCASAVLERTQKDGGATAGAVAARKGSVCVSLRRETRRRSELGAVAAASPLRSEKVKILLSCYKFTRGMNNFFFYQAKAKIFCSLSGKKWSV